MVLTAARDVAAGEVLRSDDVTRSAYDPDSVPAGVLDEDAALGRTTTVPLRRGEPVTGSTWSPQTLSPTPAPGWSRGTCRCWRSRSQGRRRPG